MFVNIKLSFQIYNLDKQKVLFYLKKYADCFIYKNETTSNHARDFIL